MRANKLNRATIRLIVQCRLLSMTPWLNLAARPPAAAASSRSPRSPELHRRPEPESANNNSAKKKWRRRSAATPPQAARAGRSRSRVALLTDVAGSALARTREMRANKLNRATIRLIVQCRLLSMTPWLNLAARPPAAAASSRSPRSPELHRRPEPESANNNSAKKKWRRRSAATPPQAARAGRSRSRVALLTDVAGSALARTREMRANKLNRATIRLIVQCRLLSMTPWLNLAARPPAAAASSRSPRSPELHRRPEPESANNNSAKKKWRRRSAATPPQAARAGRSRSRVALLTDVAGSASRARGK